MGGKKRAQPRKGGAELEPIGVDGVYALFLAERHASKENKAAALEEAQQALSHLSRSGELHVFFAFLARLGLGAVGLG